MESTSVGKYWEKPMSRQMGLVRKFTFYYRFESDLKKYQKLGDGKKMLKQEISSANTSQKQIPAITKNLMEVIGNIQTFVPNIGRLKLLDYGCGKYDLFENYCQNELGLDYYGYDKYNRDFLTNFQALTCDPNIVTCNNVLNVIQDNEIMENIVKQISEMECISIFKVYEGNRTGLGKTTKNDCYQRNEKAVQYMEILYKYFVNVDKKGDVFICY